MAKKPMTKTQIVAQMSETMQVPKKQAAAWFKSIADLAAKETKRTGQFIIPGIGKLVKAQRKARKGRNPQTGEQIRIRKDGGQVSSSESLPGRRRLTEEVAHKRRLGMSYRTTDAR